MKPSALRKHFPSFELPRCSLINRFRKRTEKSVSAGEKKRAVSAIKDILCFLIIRGKKILAFAEEKGREGVYIKHLCFSQLAGTFFMLLLHFSFSRVIQKDERFCINLSYQLSHAIKLEKRSMDWISISPLYPFEFFSFKRSLVEASIRDNNEISKKFFSCVEDDFKGQEIGFVHN